MDCAAGFSLFAAHHFHFISQLMILQTTRLENVYVLLFWVFSGVHSFPYNVEVHLHLTPAWMKTSSVTVKSKSALEFVPLLLWDVDVFTGKSWLSESFIVLV